MNGIGLAMLMFIISSFFLRSTIQLLLGALLLWLGGMLYKPVAEELGLPHKTPYDLVVSTVSGAAALLTPTAATAPPAAITSQPTPMAASPASADSRWPNNPQPVAKPEPTPIALVVPKNEISPSAPVKATGKEATVTYRVVIPAGTSVVIDAYQVDVHGPGAIVVLAGPLDRQVTITDGAAQMVNAVDACALVQAKRGYFMAQGYPLAVYQPPAGCS